MDRDDIILHLAEVPGHTAEALRGLQDADIRRSYEGGWSMIQYAAHLADAARVYDERLRRLANEENPHLPAYNPDAYAAEFRYHEMDPEDVLLRLTQHRAATIEFLRSLDEGQWERPGVHEEDGPITLRGLAEHMAHHEGDHVSTIRGLRRLALER